MALTATEHARRAASIAIAIALLGCGGREIAPDAPEPGAVDIRQAHGSASNLSGEWAQLVVTTAVSSAPLVGEVTTVNHRFFHVTLTQQGPAIQASAELCDMRVETSTSMASTVIPSAFVDAIGTSEWDATLRAGVFESAETRQSLGLEGVGAEDEMPTDPSDPRVTDPDNDGEPGMTIQVTGLAGGEMYFVQRGWRALRSTSIHGARIDGEVAWDDERVVLDATSRSLRNARPSVPSEEPGAHYFQMVRVQAGTTCASVVDAGLPLFAR